MPEKRKISRYTISDKAMFVDKHIGYYALDRKTNRKVFMTFRQLSDFAKKNKTFADYNHIYWEDGKVKCGLDFYDDEVIHVKRYPGLVLRREDGTLTEAVKDDPSHFFRMRLEEDLILSNYTEYANKYIGLLSDSISKQTYTDINILPYVETWDLSKIIKKVGLETIEEEIPEAETAVIIPKGSEVIYKGIKITRVDEKTLLWLGGNADGIDNSEMLFIINVRGHNLVLIRNYYEVYEDYWDGGQLIKNFTGKVIAYTKKEIPKLKMLGIAYNEDDYTFTV